MPCPPPRRTTLVLAAVLGMGCVHAPPGEAYAAESYVRARWLPPLHDGTTRRDDVIAELGAPTATFQAGRIHAYRLLLVERDAPLASSGYDTLVSFWGGIVGTDARREALSTERRALVVMREAPDDERLLWELTREAEYGLVLVFDQGGMLQRHRLTRVLP